jgi:hypothetical protein
MIAIGVAVLLLIVGTVVQVAGIRSGAYSRAGSVRDRLPYGIGAVSCWLAAVMLLIGALQTVS